MAAGSFRWRAFAFFDRSVVKDTATGQPHALLQDLTLTCATSGRGALVLGDGSGMVRVVDRNFSAVASFQAYAGTVSLLHQLKGSGVLISLGTDGRETGVLKVWSFDRPDSSGAPSCARVVKLLNGQFSGISDITCFAVLEPGAGSAALAAVGFDNGAVILIRGDLARERFSRQSLLVQASAGDSITGLGFRVADGTSFLFVSTRSRTTCWTIGSKTATSETLDQAGCAPRCAAVSDSGHFVLARKEALFFYDEVGRGAAFAFDGPKLRLTWFRQYAVVVSQDMAQEDKHAVFVYDLSNRFIALQAVLPPVTHVLHEWGIIFIFTADGKMIQLEEKDTQTKLEMLFRHNLYQVAISLATSQQFDETSVVDIFRKYGDHLYSRNDYDGAMVQYLKTIGRLEPSYVIRRYLDAQRIHSLTEYLEALHHRLLATADHTTLLLNCYTKLKDVEKLDVFVRGAATEFDVGTAIKVLRQAGYNDHAVYLAAKHADHHMYLKIQIEDCRAFHEALEYLASLAFADAEEGMRTYGKQLIGAIPEETTAFLRKLCTEYRPSARKVGPETPNVATRVATRAAGASVVPGTAAATAAVASAAAASASASGSAGKASPRSELLATTRSRRSAVAEDVARGASVPTPFASANPEDFIHIYVEQPGWLLVFLEAMVAAKPDTASEPVYNTLLELYLRDDYQCVRQSSDAAATTAADGDVAAATADGRVGGEERKRRRAAAMAMLRSSARYSADHALVLAKMYDFPAGLLYLYEKMNLHREIVQHFMDTQQHDALILACRKYGRQERDLWVSLLTYFASLPEDMSDRLAKVLGYIDQDKLLPPMLVLQALASTDHVRLGVVRDYLSRCLVQDKRKSEEDEAAIKQLREETTRMQRELDETKHRAKVFQRTKCSSCGSGLDLPAIHFYCNHSFHQRCLGTQDQECPVCAPEHRRVIEQKRSIEAEAGSQSQFQKRLDAAQDDGFAVITDVFGRNVFNQIRFVGDAGAPGAASSSVPVNEDAARADLFARPLPGGL